jgi:AcrR family transcriptional regulator
MREKIVRAAEARFRHYGYEKTTVADIAKDLKVSTAYVYKFYESKLALNEAVAVDVLARIDAALWATAHGGGSAEVRLRAVYHTLLEESVSRFFNDRKLHEMVVSAVENDWCAVARHKEAIAGVVKHLLTEGRQAGEFETRSDLAVSTAAVFHTLIAFGHPLILQQSIDQDLHRQADAVADLIIKGLKA